MSAQPTTRREPRDGLVYIRIPPGAYANGCSPGDPDCFAWEPPAHRVTIARGFWIGQTEVTQRAYQSVMHANPSRYRDPDRPAEQIPWTGARSYCEAVGLRLPTESEWEYAARAGSTTARYSDLNAVAWYHSNSADQTHPVAQKMPNAFGLYDMLGNVWEWVADTYGADPAKHILRGGSFYNLARDLRVSNRLWAAPDTAHRNIGFRCAGDAAPNR
jgi:formylglycine-generating enzyme required for sulfatase activity